MRNAILIACLLFLTSLSYWYLQGFDDDSAASQDQESEENLFTAFNVEAKYYAAEGHLLYQIKSNEVSELAKKRGTLFTQPVIENYNPQHVVEWLGSSNQANLSADKNDVLMQDNVEVIQSPNNPNSMQLTGESLQYNAMTDRIFSQQPVLISDGIISQTSNRFSLNIKTDKITFNDGVEANYQNENKNK